MTKPNPTHKSRRTLRQALRDLLKRNSRPRANDVPSHQTVGSGILKKVPGPAPQLPNFSTLSVLPDFDTINYSFAPPLPPPPSSPIDTARRSPDPRPTKSSGRLLPARSLSHFDLRTPYLEPSSVRQVYYDSVPSACHVGVSRQASLASITSTSGVSVRAQPSVSTLRIRNSKSSICLASTSPQPANSGTSASQPSQRYLQPPRQSHSSLKRASTRQSIGGDSKQTHLGSPFNDRMQTPGPPAPARTAAPPPKRTPLTMVDHFKCFVVLDTAQPGCPVTGTSSDLRYIFEVGEQFMLNNKDCEGSSMDIFSGLDAMGNEVIHLSLFTPLVSPNSGRSRFMLVSLVDVTDFVIESANQIPELDTISEEASFTDEIVTPSANDSPHWSSLNYKLSADDMLGGCSLPGDEDDFPIGNKEANDDIWLALAATEGGFKPNRRRGYQSSRSSQTSSERSSVRSHASSTDDILEDFMSNLQELYSDFFLLGPSPLADDAYEICNISPRVYESKEYVEGHLSRTSAADIEQLSVNLAQPEPFTLKVRWGTQGLEKQLYCSPLYAGSAITWICYLVDAHMEQLWQ